METKTRQQLRDLGETEKSIDYLLAQHDPTASDETPGPLGMALSIDEE